MLTVKYTANTLNLRMLRNQASEDRGKRIEIGYIQLSDEINEFSLSIIEEEFDVEIILYERYN